MLILLLGLAVLASCASLLLFLGPCIGRWVLRTWVIFGSSCLELLILFEHWSGHRLLNEKVIRPLLRANRPFSLLRLYQRKLKFDMVVSTSVVWLGLFLRSLVVLVGSCHVVLVLTCLG